MKFKIGALYLNTDHITKAIVSQRRNGEGELIADKYRVEIDTTDGKSFFILSEDSAYQRIIDILDSDFLDLSPV